MCLWINCEGFCPYKVLLFTVHNCRCSAISTYIHYKPFGTVKISGHVWIELNYTIIYCKALLFCGWLFLWSLLISAVHCYFVILKCWALHYVRAVILLTEIFVILCKPWKSTKMFNLRYTVLPTLCYKVGVYECKCVDVVVWQGHIEWCQ